MFDAPVRARRPSAPKTLTAVTEPEEFISQTGTIPSYKKSAASGAAAYFAMPGYHFLLPLYASPKPAIANTMVITKKIVPRCAAPAVMCPL
jgi:hypothetical protein